MEIHLVTEIDDFDAIGNIYVQSWRTAYQGIVPKGYLEELESSQWTPILHNHEYETYVICDEGNYVGVSSIGPARDEQMTAWGEITSFYLLPEFFGKGYGKQLLAHIIDVFADKGYMNMYLWVLEQNIRAQRFYEKHGFFRDSDEALVTIAGKELVEIRYARPAL